MKVPFDKLIIGRDFPFLGKREIHLWRVSLNPSDQVLEASKQALSSFERGRLDFFEFEQVRKNYTVSQGILRLLVSRYLGVEVEDVELGRRSKGKPYCVNDESLYFNISNSGGLCVFAFSREHEVGIDLEKIRPLPDLDVMIETNFSAAEQAYIRKVKNEEERRFFFYWTIKESYLKAIGVGMRIEPQKLEFSIQQGQIRLLSVNGIAEYDDWIFEEIPFSPEYVRTLTYMGKGTAFSDFELI